MSWNDTLFKYIWYKITLKTENRLGIHYNSELFKVIILYIARIPNVAGTSIQRVPIGTILTSSVQPRSISHPPLVGLFIVTGLIYFISIQSTVSLVYLYVYTQQSIIGLFIHIEHSILGLFIYTQQSIIGLFIYTYI